MRSPTLQLAASRWPTLAMSGFVLTALTIFLRRTPDAFPFGDAAVTQVYTLEALRGFLKLGPYSQFGWHHPGPLYFYLLAPFYELGGRRTIGLVAAAAAINLASLMAIGRLVDRGAGRFAAAAVVATLTIFLWRADGLVGSIWNAHVVIVPFAALIVSCAALACGDLAALPVTLLVGSFVMQTDIALVPCSVLMMALAITVTGARRRRRLMSASRSLWLCAAIGILVWMPSIVEQISGAPGNITRLWHYLFVAEHSGQSARTAFLVWSDVTTAFVRTNLAVAWGAAYQARPSSSTAVLVVIQVLLLVVALVRCCNTGQRFIAVLCLFVMLASIICGWSITRIDDEIGDYQVFWISVVGVLGWAAMLTTFVPRAYSTVSTNSLRFANAFSVVATAGAICLAMHALLAARAYAVEQRDTPVKRQLVALDVLKYIDREQVRRPLFHVAQDTWLDAACVILQAYKHHPRLAVDQQWVPVFGEALSPTGREDIDFFIVDGAAHTTLSARTGDRIVAAHDGLFVHAFTRHNFSVVTPADSVLRQNR